MQYSPKSPQYCRDKALEYLKRGRDLFNSKKDSFQKEAGYEMFKKGIEKMIEFAKRKISFQFQFPSRKRP